jgi:hypothetical protein
MREAKLVLNKKGIQIGQVCCQKPKYKSAGGFQWRFKINNQIPLKIAPCNKKKNQFC